MVLFSFLSCEKANDSLFDEENILLTTKSLSLELPPEATHNFCVHVTDTAGNPTPALVSIHPGQDPTMAPFFEECTVLNDSVIVSKVYFNLPLEIGTFYVRVLDVRGMTYFSNPITVTSNLQIWRVKVGEGADSTNPTNPTIVGFSNAHK